MIPQRYQRLTSVLDKRQPDLTVVMNNVHKAHNLAAIIRSCDATGVLKAHAVSPHPQIRLRQKAASGSGKWVQVGLHQRLDHAVGELKQTGHQLIGLHLDPNAYDYRQIDYTKPTAIVLGEELFGLPDSALEQMDKTVYIPMLGMVESLNVSVAAALILYRAMEQRLDAGMYDQCRIAAADYEKILFEWAYPKLAKVLSKQNKPYPKIDQSGI